MEEEFEIVPLSPIRRLERRMERVERSGGSSDAVHELLEIVKTNQRVIDEMVRINTDMMSKITSLIESVSSMTGRVNDFMSRIEVVGYKPSEAADVSGALEKKMDERLAKLEKRVNALLFTAVAQQKRESPQMRRPAAPQQPRALQMI